MKGQFMLVSAILAGVILVSLASEVNSAKQVEYEVDDAANQAQHIKDIVSSADKSDASDRRRVRRIVSNLEYTAQTSYNGSCFFITLEEQERLTRLKCVD